MKLTPQKPEEKGLPYDENLIILTSTDQTDQVAWYDGQTDGRAIAHTRYSI